MRFSGVFYAAMKANETPGEIELAQNSATIYSKGNIVCSNISIQSIQNSEDIYLENGFLFVLEKTLPSEQEKLFSNNFSKVLCGLKTFHYRKLYYFQLCFFLLFRHSPTLPSHLSLMFFQQHGSRKLEKTPIMQCVRLFSKRVVCPVQELKG